MLNDLFHLVEDGSKQTQGDTAEEFLVETKSFLDIIVCKVNNILPVVKEAFTDMSTK